MLFSMQLEEIVQFSDAIAAGCSALESGCEHSRALMHVKTAQRDALPHGGA